MSRGARRTMGWVAWAPAVLLVACVDAQVTSAVEARRLAEVCVDGAGLADVSVEKIASWERPGELWEGRRGAWVIRCSRQEVPAGHAAARVNDDRALLENMYTPRLPPYPEFLTHTSDCPKAMHPRLRERADGWDAVLWASERQGFGVCDPAVAALRAGLAELRCGAAGGGATTPAAGVKEEVVRVEVFAAKETPDAEIQGLLEGLRCRERRGGGDAGR